MRELSISEMSIVSGGVNFDEATFGATLIGAGYVIASVSPAGAVVVGVGLVMGFAGGFFIGDGLANNGQYVQALDENYQEDKDGGD